MAVYVLILVAIWVLVVVTGVIEWVARELEKPAPYRDSSRGTRPVERG